MPKYYVSVPVFASAGTAVEATNEEEAIDKAISKLYPSLCHQCAGEVELGDLDYENASAEEIQ